MRTPSSRAITLDPLRAGAALDDATSRDEIFELIVRTTRARLPHVALLQVGPDELRGWGAHAGMVLTRAVPAIETALATASPAIGVLHSVDVAVDALLETLVGEAHAVLVLPIGMRTRAVAVVIAHRGAQAFSYAQVADLFPLAADADAALSRLATQRARTVAPRAPTRLPSRADSDLEVEIEIQSGPEARASEIRALLRDAPIADQEIDLLLELGQLEAGPLAHPDAAIEAWRSALTIAADEPRVLDALEQLYAQRGRWLDCVELLDRRVALTEARAARIALLLNLADIARDRLNDPRRAASAYERVVELEPGHPVASRALETLYRARQEWGPVAAQMLDRASRETDARANIAALVEVARIYEQRVGDPRAAVLVWLTLVRRDPTRAGILDEIARLAPVADAWDEILEQAAAIAEDLEAALATTAGPMWLHVGRWARDHAADRDLAVRALEAALRLGESVHAELGALYEAAPERATQHYEAALAETPEDPHVLAALHRLYLAAEAWDAIARILPRLIDALAPTAEVARIVELYVELGAVYADRLEQPEAAARAYHDALALEPTHVLARKSLAAVYERTGQAEELLELTEVEVDAGPRAEQLARYADLAAAWHELGRYDRASETWAKLVAIAPTQLAAHHGLVRSLRAAGDPHALAAALHAQQRIDASPALLLELASVLVAIDDTSGAVAALEERLAQDADDPRALDALARIHERAGRLRPALAVLQRLGALVNPRARADVLQRIAQQHLAARDASAARAVLVEAIGLDRDNADAREAMARVHLQQGELSSAGEQLLAAARLHATTDDSLRCLADAAWLYRHRIGDTARARECLSRILELDPAHGDAKHAMAELLHEGQEWAALWPHLEDKVARASGTPAERRDIFLEAARCAVELGKHDRARDLYERAHAALPGPDVELARGEALYRAQQLDAAVRVLQALARDAQQLTRAQRIAVYRRLAQIFTETGRAAEAQQLHGKVLDLDPRHEGALADLVELHLAAKRYDDAIASLRELASVVAPLDRVALLERVGDLYRHQLANPSRAMSTYLDALEIDRANRRVLQRLLDVQTATQQWPRAVQTITTFLEHETDAARRAAYHLAAAAIEKTELRDLQAALARYDAALDELARAEQRERATRVFADVVALVTAEGDWKYLEQAYRRMIKRLPAGEPALVGLWDALGELCHTRLAHVNSAVQAYEVAHALDPAASPERARILGELYARIGAPAAAAVAKLVADDPTNPDRYHSLVSTALAANKLDEAWCAARALVLLGHATFDEELLYRKYQPHEVRKARGVIDETAWASVRHPDEDRVITSVFSLIWEQVVSLRAGTAKSFELHERERLSLDDDSRVVARIFRHAARVLAVTMPPIYVQPRRAGSLLLANTRVDGRLVPAIIVGREMMTGYRDTELAAAVGALVALLRPAYYLKLALATTDELEAALAAAAQLAGRTIGRPALEPLVAAFAPAIRGSLSRSAAETLVALVDRLPERPDLATWRASVDAAAQRAALLVSGDLEATARMAMLSGPRGAREVGALVAYSVSPAYTGLRTQLGVALRPA